jgi:hypothetical protein
VGWDSKVVFFVIVAGIGTAVIIGLVKLGEIIVRRRTNALLAAHSELQDEAGDDAEESS